MKLLISESGARYVKDAVVSVYPSHPTEKLTEIDLSLAEEPLKNLFLKNLYDDKLLARLKKQHQERKKILEKIDQARKK